MHIRAFVQVHLDRFQSRRPPKLSSKYLKGKITAESYSPSSSSPSSSSIPPKGSSISPVNHSTAEEITCSLTASHFSTSSSLILLLHLELKMKTWRTPTLKPIQMHLNKSPNVHNNKINNIQSNCTSFARFIWVLQNEV